MILVFGEVHVRGEKHSLAPGLHMSTFYKLDINHEPIAGVYRAHRPDVDDGAGWSVEARVAEALAPGIVTRSSVSAVDLTEVSMETNTMSTCGGDIEAVSLVRRRPRVVRGRTVPQRAVPTEVFRLLNLSTSEPHRPSRIA